MQKTNRSVDVFLNEKIAADSNFDVSRILENKKIMQYLYSDGKYFRSRNVTGQVTQCHAAEEEREEDIEIDNNSQKESKPKKKFSSDDGDAPPDVSPASGTDARPQKEEKVFDKDSDAYKAAAYLARRIEKHYPNVKPPTEKDKQRWAADFDKCNRIDGYDWWDISDVLRFSQQSPFWRKNILSGKKFREKYERLLIEMTEEAKKNGK